MSAQVRATIREAAERYGIDPALADRVAAIESTYNPSATNPSGASGLFQFMPSTWKAMGGGANVFDPAANADAGVRYLRDNQKHLRSVLGADPEPWQVYLAHQQGPGGAARLLSNPSANAADLVGTAAVVQNGGRADMTAAQFADMWRRKYGGDEAAPAQSRSWADILLGIRQAQAEDVPLPAPDQLRGQRAETDIPLPSPDELRARMAAPTGAEPQVPLPSPTQMRMGTPAQEPTAPAATPAPPTSPTDIAAGAIGDLAQSAWDELRKPPLDTSIWRKALSGDTAGAWEDYKRGVAGFTQPLGMGVTLGWQNKGLAGLESLLGRGSYRENLGRISGNYEQVPALQRFIGELVGGAGPAMTGPLTGLRGVGNAVGQGAVAGAGYAPPGEELPGAVKGGALTGTLSSLMLGAERYLPGAGRYLASLFDDSEKAAQRTAVDMLAARGKTAAGVADTMREEAIAGRTAMPIDEMGVPPRVNPESAGIMQDALVTRSGDNMARLEAVAGTGSRADVRAVKDSVAAGKAEAQAMVEKAIADKPFISNTITIKEPPSTPTVSERTMRNPYRSGPGTTPTPTKPETVETPPIPSEVWDNYYLRKARAMAGRGLDNEANAPGGMSMRHLDRVYSRLNAVAEAEYNKLGAAAGKDAAASPGVAMIARDINNVRKAFRDEVRKINPEWAAAKEAFADDFEVESARRLGQNFLKKDAEHAADVIAAFHPDAQAAFHTSAANTLIEMVGSNKLSAARLRLPTELRARFENAFGDPKRASTFIDEMVRQAQQAETLSNVSATRSTLSREGLPVSNMTVSSGGRSFTETGASNKVVAVLSGIRDVIRAGYRGGSITHAQEVSLARALTETDPAKQAQWLAAVGKLAPTPPTGIPTARVRAATIPLTSRPNDTEE